MNGERWDAWPADVGRRDTIVGAHERAVAAGEDGYFDPFTGLYVFTAVSLARRPCCGNRCRHCPYEDWTEDWAAEST